mgnify:CR=1 FL=1
MAGGLTKHQLEIIAVAVMKEQKKHEGKSQAVKKDWRLRNTKLLLRHYRWLQLHCEEIIEDLEEYEDVIFDPEELNLKALMKYKAKTKKMMDYFDATWGSYYSHSKNRGRMAQRRADVLYRLYISPDEMKKVELADLHYVDESTIRRDESKATHELSIFLFGIDSLNDLEKILSTV